MSSAQQVQRQLEEAYMHQKRMKDEYRAAIHKVAASSANEKKRGNGTGRAVDRPGGSDTTMHSHTAGREDCPAIAEEGQDHQFKVEKNDQAIAAYRPSEKPAESPTISQDTFGREVDAAIRRNVEQVVKASKEQDQVAPKEDWGHVVITSNEATMNNSNPAKQQVLPSPAFFTVKRRAMHCEIDDPGFGIAYPKQYPRKTFLQKIMGCFHKPSVYSPQRMRTPPPRPPSAGMEPPKLTLEAEVAPLRRSLSTFVDSTQETTTQNTQPHVANMHELGGDDVSLQEAKENIESYRDLDDMHGNGSDHSADCDEEKEHTLENLKREDSFESLVAETSDGGDTPDHRDQRNVKSKYESKIPIPSILSKPPMSEAKQSSIAVSELIHPRKKQAKVISYRENYARRKSSVASLGAKSVTSSSTKLYTTGQRRGAKETASMFRQTANSSAPSSGASSPLKPPKIVPRMTKAALARSEANKKAIESRIREEKAHWENLPAAVKKTSRAESVQTANECSGLVPPSAGSKQNNMIWQSQNIPHTEHKLRESDESLESVDILSMMRPDELENREDILSQSIQSYLPKLSRSIEVLKTGEEGKNFTPAKLACIEEAAVNVHSCFSEKNNILSMSFSDDPFFQELNKLDHTLTQEDLDKLRDVLMKSTITDDSLQ